MTTDAQRLVLADRMQAVGFSEIVKVRNKILELRERGQHVFQFEGGEPFPNTPDVVKEACARALAENKTRYAPSSGITPLVEALAEKLSRENGIPASPSNVIVVAGGMHALSCAFQAVVNPGDEVLMFSPYWTPMRDLVGLTRATTVLVDTARSRGEKLRDALESKITDRTRCIYVNTPQNPSGVVFTRAELETIASVARDYDLIVVSDEAYEHLVYDVEHVSIASLPEMFERTISCYTFSKSYAMTGWRLGYAVAAEPFITGLRKLVLNSTNGVSTPTQWAGLAAITQAGEFTEWCRREYRTRRDLLVAGLESVGFEIEPPPGAFYAFPRMGAFGEDSWALSNTLLERANVACLPGVIFGPEGEGHLRFSYSTSIETIERGLDALASALR